MAQILKFPNKHILPVRVGPGLTHYIDVEILDTVRPRRTRWQVQFEIQEVAGCGSPLKGFKDAAVAGGYRHRFTVNDVAAVRAFVRHTAKFVAAGKVAVWVDGKRVRPSVAPVTRVARGP